MADEADLAKNLWIYVGNLDWHSPPEVVERTLAQLLQSISVKTGESAEGDLHSVSIDNNNGGRTLADIATESEVVLWRDGEKRKNKEDWPLMPSELEGWAVKQGNRIRTMGCHVREALDRPTVPDWINTLQLDSEVETGSTQIVDASPRQQVVVATPLSKARRCG